MGTMIETLQYYLEFEFVRYAIIVGVLVALCASLLGVILVLKRFSFIGDGLSHVAFGAVSIASVINLTNEMLLVLPITIICAIVLLKGGQNRKIQGDASIALISVSALAIGYLVVNVLSTSNNIAGDVCTTLFGSTAILTLTELEVWMSIGLAILVIVVFLAFYNKLFAITFDEDFATATGINTEMYNLILATIIAIVIVLAMNLVGSLLISALVVFPPLSAMRLIKNFKAVILFSGALSIIGALIGTIAAILWGTPVGSTIVIVYLVIFLVCTLLGKVVKG